MVNPECVAMRPFGEPRRERVSRPFPRHANVCGGPESLGFPLANCCRTAHPAAATNRCKTPRMRRPEAGAQLAFSAMAGFVELLGRRLFAVGADRL